MKNKKLLLFLIILIITTVSILLNLNNKVYAKVNDGDPEYKIGDTPYVSDIPDSKWNSWFCLELTVDAAGSSYFKIVHKVEITSSGKCIIDGIENNSSYKAFAALAWLSDKATKEHTTTRSSNRYYDFETAYQLCLQDRFQSASWQFFKKHGSSVLGINGYSFDTSFGDVVYSEERRSVGDTFVSTMDKILNGSESYKKNAVFYFYTQCDNNGNLLQKQKFIDIYTGDKIEIKLPLKKVDSTDIEKPLQGVKLKVEAVSNCIINSSNTITSGANGEFENISIEPIVDTNDTVKIKVTELQNKDGYLLLNDGKPVTLTIKYNTDNGTINSISAPTELADYFNWNGIVAGKLIVKNDPVIKLKLQKFDTAGNAVKDVKISVTGVDNVKAIKGLINLGNYEGLISDANGVFTDGDYNTTGVYKVDGTYSSTMLSDLIEIVPIENNGKIQIKITEEEVPEPYQKFEDMIIEIEYSHGKITSIKVNNNGLDKGNVLDYYGNGAVAAIGSDTATVALVNSIKPFDLKIVKDDTTGKRLDSGYKFTLKTDYDVTIEVDRSYVQADKYTWKQADNTYTLSGKEFYLKTDDNGEIYIRKIYVGNLNLLITLEETDTGSVLFGKINGSINVDLKNQEITSNNENVIEVVDNAKREIHVKEIPNEITLDLTKVPDVGTIGIDGAKFNITLSADGVTPITKTGVVTKNGGKIIEEFNMKDFIGKDVITLTLTENYAPEPYITPTGDSATKIITFKYVNNGGTAKYQIMDNANGAASIDDKMPNKINVKFLNYLPLDLKVKKEFYDYEKKLITKELEGDVELNVTLSGCKAKINGNELESRGAAGIKLNKDNNFEIAINGIKLDNNQKSGTIKIEETKTLNNFVRITGVREFKVERNQNTGEWIVSNPNGYVDAVLENNGKTIVLKNYSLGSIPLTIQKADPTSEGKKLGAGYKFTITIPNTQKIKIDKKYVQTDYEGYKGKLPNGLDIELKPVDNKYYLQTAEDGKIELAIYPNSGVTTLNATVEETEVGNKLFKTVTGKLTIKNNGDGTIELTPDASGVIEVVAQNLIKVNEKAEDILLHIAKFDNLGNKLTGATANVKLEAYNEETTKTVYSKNNISFGEFTSEGIDITKYLKDDLINFKLTISEITAPTVYKVLTNPVEVEFSYDYNGGNPKYTLGEYNAKKANINENEIYVQVENELEDLNITIEKLFKDKNENDITDTVKTSDLTEGNEVVFDITFEGCSAIIDSNNEADRVSSKNTKVIGLGAGDNHIYINNVKLNEGSEQGVIVVKETNYLYGYTYNTEEMRFYVTRDASKNYIWKLTSADEYDDVEVVDAAKLIKITNRKDKPISYPLTLKKVDALGNPVGEGYFFEINIEEANYIEVEEAYIQDVTGLEKIAGTTKYKLSSQPFKLKTGSDSLISMEVYPDTTKDLSKESNITIKETRSRGVFGLVETALKVRHDGNKVILTKNGSNIEVPEDYSSKANLVNIKEKEEVKIELVKLNELKEQIEGAKAKVVLKDAEGNKIWKYTDASGKEEVSFGDFTSEVIDITERLLAGKTNFTLEVTEITAPEGYEVLTNKVEVKFHYEFSSGEGKYIIDEVTPNNVNAEIKKTDAKILKVEVENKAIGKLDVEKKFYDYNGNEIKASKVLVDGEDVTFDINLIDCTGKIGSDTEARTGRTGVSLKNEGIVTGAGTPSETIIIPITQIKLAEGKSAGKIEIKETATASGYTYYEGTMEFNVLLGTNGLNITSGEYEGVVLDSENSKVTIENNMKPYTLKLLKVDPAGNLLGDDYKFDVTIAEAQSIEIDSKYVQNQASLIMPEVASTVVLTGTNYKLQTVDGVIEFKVNPNEELDLSKETEIKFVETESGSNVFDLIQINATVKHDKTTGKTIIESEDSETVTFNSSTNTWEIKAEEDLAKLNLDLTKTIRDMGYGEGAKFDITLNVKGTDIYNANNKEVDASGKITENLDIKALVEAKGLTLKDFIENEVTLTLVETKEPEGAKKVPAGGVSFVVKFHYENNDGEATYVINEGTDYAKYNDKTNTIELAIENIPVTELPLQKKFVNLTGDDVTGDVLNTLANGEDVLFDISFTNLTGKIGSSTEASTGRTGVSLKTEGVRTGNEVIIPITELELAEGKTVGYVNVTETETAPGYKKIVNKITFEVKIVGNEWVKTEKTDYSYVWIENGKAIIVNEPIQPKHVTLLKVDEEANPIEGIKFIFDIESIQSCKVNGTNYTADAGKVHIDEDNVKTNKDGKIEITDIITENNTVTVKATESLTEDQKKTFEEIGTITKVVDLTSEEDIVITAVNTPKYPLTIKKVDSSGHALSEGYKFTIEIDNAKKIQVLPEYVQTDKEEYAGLTEQDGYYTIEGTTFYLQTDEDGNIKIENVYAKSIYSTIILNETEAGSKVFGLAETGLLTEYDAENGIIKIKKLNNDDVNLQVEGNTEAKLEEELNDLTLDLTKIVKGIGKANGAKFDISMEACGKTIYTGNGTTNADGKIVDTIDIKENVKAQGLTLKEFIENEVTLTLVETKAPTGCVPVPADGITYIVKFHYENNDGKATYVISGGTDYAKYNEETNSIEVEKENTLLPITILKEFVDAGGNKLEETNTSMVKFDITLDGFNAKINGVNVEEGSKKEGIGLDSSNKIKLEEIEFTGGTEGTITIKETATIDGYEGVGTATFKISVDVATRELTITKTAGSEDVQIDNDTAVIKVTNRKTYPLKIVKVDSLGERLGAGYEFTVKISNADGIKVKGKYIQVEEYPDLRINLATNAEKDYPLDGTEFNLVTDENGEIEISDIYGKVPSTIELWETTPGSTAMKQIVGNIAVSVVSKENKIEYISNNSNVLKIEEETLYVKNEPEINLKLIKEDNAGNRISGVPFETTVKAPNGEEIKYNNTTDEHGEIPLKIDNIGSYLTGTNKKFVVELTEIVPAGYVGSGTEKTYSYTFEYKNENGIVTYDVKNGTTNGVNSLKYDESKNTIEATVENEPKKANLIIDKKFVDEAGQDKTEDEKSKANNVKFTIKFQDCKAQVDNKLLGTVFENIVLGNDLKIEVNNIVLDTGKTQGIMIVVETQTIDGYEKIIGELKFNIKIDSDKNVIISDPIHENVEVNNGSDPRKITIINKKYYPLTIVKVDPLGQSLGEGYKFDVTIDGARGIVLKDKYIQGKSGEGSTELESQPFKLVTDNQGKIEIERVYASAPTTIVLKETEVGQTGNKIIQKISGDITINSKIDGTKVVFESSNENISVNENTIYVKDEPVVNVNLRKTDGTDMIQGAIFTVNMKVQGEENYLKDENGVEIKNRKITIGEETLNNINISEYVDKTIELLAHEDYVPEEFQEPETRDYKVTFKYENNGGVPGYNIISTEPNDENAIKANYERTNNIIDVEIKNKPVEYFFSIEKIFKDENGKIVTENPNNVEFELTFDGLTAIVDDYGRISNKTTIAVGNDNIIKLTDVQFTNVEKKGTLTVKETKEQSGYRNAGTFVFNVKVEDRKLVIEESKEYTNASIDSVENKISIVNDKTYPLLIQKLDNKGNKLGANFKFEVTINEAEKIVVNEQYIDKDKYPGVTLSGDCTLEGEKYYLKTNSSGEIIIKEVHAPIPTDIDIKEYYSPSKIFTKLVSGKVSTGYSDGKFVLTTTSDVIKVDNSLGLIKIINSPELDVPPIVKVAKNSSGEYVGLKGAKFIVDLTAGGKSLIKENDDDTIIKETDKNGMFEIGKIDISEHLGEDITLTLIEYQEPQNAQERTGEGKKSTVVFKYNYNNGVPKYEISNKTNCVTYTDNGVLKVRIENTKLPYVTIEKLFKDESGADITEIVKSSNLTNGNEVQFNITLKDAEAKIDNTIDLKDGVKVENVGLGANDNYIHIEDIKLKSGKNQAKLTVEETKTVSGFTRLTAKYTFTITVDNNLDWNITESYADVEVSNDSKIITIINRKNPTPNKVNLNVSKISNTNEKLNDVKFKVTMQVVGGTYLKDSRGNSINGLEFTTGKSHYGEPRKDGEFVINDIDISEYEGFDIVATLEEVEVPAGYINKESKISVIKFKYDGSKFVKLSDSNCKEAAFNANTLNVTIENIEKLPDIKILKEDNLGNKVEGIGFKAEISGIKTLKYTDRNNANAIAEADASGKIKITSLVTSSNGLIEITDLVPTNLNNASEIEMVLTEVDSQGYKKLDNPIVLTYNYDPSTGKITNEKAEHGSNDKVTFNYNKPDKIMEMVVENQDIVNLTFVKKDSVTGDPLQGVQFKLDFGGVVNTLKVNGETRSGESANIMTLETNSEGKIVLEEIVLNRNETTLKVEEITKPEDGDGYYYEKLNKTIEYKIIKNSSGLSINLLDGNTQVTQGAVNKQLSELTNATVSGNSGVITIKNVPLMDLSGRVWLDGQTGKKNVHTPDGIRNEDDSALQEGVNVYLYTGKGKQVTTAPQKTDSKGEYSYIGIEKIAEGYKVSFEYNGIDYENTKDNQEANDAIDSDATEDWFGEMIGDNQADYTRNKLNNRFTTIAQNKAIDKSGENETALTYEYTREPNNVTADLQAYIDGCNPAYGNHDETKYEGSFKVRAATEVYKKTTENIDLGLIERFFDLSLSNYIHEVNYYINGTEITQQGADGNKQNPNDNKINAENLFDSDYSYRFDDYKFDNEKAFDNEGAYDESGNSIIPKDMHSELEIYVKYYLNIQNATYSENGDETESHKAENAIVRYTYDSTKYKFVQDGSTVTPKPGSPEGVMLLEISGDDIDEGKANVLIFQLQKEEGTRNLPQEMKNLEGLTLTNEAEIIEYTTKNGGFVDYDSAPDDNEILEDDQNLYTITFKLKEDEREISGNVAEADRKEKDGTIYGVLNNNNINGVIVQLVEIIKKTSSVDGSDYYKELIWQETITGSSKVKARGKDGEVYLYDNGLTSEDKGKYKFLSKSMEASLLHEDGSIGRTVSLDTGFIPGKNYIVRFIYGDGRVYNYGNENVIDLLDNASRYNGQDYKSTIDTHYTDKWYNKENDGDLPELTDESNKYTNGLDPSQKVSVARDNEARRLETMAISTSIDGKLGEAFSFIGNANNEDRSYNNLTDKEKELIDAYINEYFKDFTDFEEIKALSGDKKIELIKRDILDKTYMSAETSIIDVPIRTAKYTNVNFGLEERPKTKIELEKHVTALKITTTSGKTIVDAKIKEGINGATGNTYLEDYLLHDSEPVIDGERSGLSAIKSMRDNRGFWKVETAIEELAQGATLEVEYTYVIKNNSDEDYLSETLIKKYGEGITEYEKTLKKAAANINEVVDGNGYNSKIGTYLSKFYYTGKHDVSDKPVLSRVEQLEESLNNNLALRENQYDVGGYFKIAKNLTKAVYTLKAITDTESKTERETVKINNTIKTKSASADLETGSSDYSKKVWLSKVLSGSSAEITYPSYIAEITKFTNAAGRRNFYDKDVYNPDTKSLEKVALAQTPENLDYVHSDDKKMTLDNVAARIDRTIDYISEIAADFINASDNGNLVKFRRLNEADEFWGETIMITKPTGEDRSFPVQMVIIVASSILAIGAGIILIKKYALKK